MVAKSVPDVIVCNPFNSARGVKSVIRAPGWLCRKLRLFNCCKSACVSSPVGFPKASRIAAWASALLGTSLIGVGGSTPAPQPSTEKKSSRTIGEILIVATDSKTPAIH
jgi:hypothetical protein